MYSLQQLYGVNGLNYDFGQKTKCETIAMYRSPKERSLFIANIDLLYMMVYREEIFCVLGLIAHDTVGVVL